MRTALVTGAASGIGRATAKRLAGNGWRVYAGDVDENGLASLEGPTTVKMDVTAEPDCKRVRDRIDANVGGLDCLVVNAGYAQLGPLADLPSECLDAQLSVNVVGAHRTIATFLPLLAERVGTIVAVSSTHGRVTTPGLGAYAMSKRALEALVETVRMEVEDYDGEVALVEPAWVETGFADESERTLDGVERSEEFADIYDAMAESVHSRADIAVSRHSLLCHMPPFTKILTRY
ncbi:MAG: SDR family NAD(P)-dependent oxidoreductase [Halapricum sp.]